MIDHKISVDKISEVSIVLYILLLSIYTVLSNFNGFPTYFRLLLLALRVVTYGVMALALLLIFTKIHKNVLLYCINIAVFLLLNYLVYSQIPERFGEYMNAFLILCIPMSILMVYAEGKEVLHYMNYAGMILGVFYFCVIVLNKIGFLKITGYSMAIGYSPILVELCLLASIKSERILLKKVMYCFSLLFYLLVVVLYGSRGPLVTIFVFGVYEYIFCTMFRGEHKKRVIFSTLIIFLVACATPIMLNLQSIMQNLVFKLGIESRTLDLLINNLGHMSGRDTIYDNLIHIIEMNPLAVRGIASETMVTVGQQYAHNIFLELCYQFGAFFGFIFIAFIAYRVVKTIKKDVNQEGKLNVILMFGCIPQLIFSSTLWMNYTFWMWIVRSTIGIHKGRKETYEKEENRF